MSTTLPPAGKRQGPFQGATVFLVFWAITHISILLNFPDWYQHPTFLLIFFSCLGFLAFPEKTFLFMIAALIQTISAAEFYPFTTEMWFVVAMINMVLLLTYWKSLWKESGQDKSWVVLLRWFLIILMFWGFFHKLNRDFLNPELSCAVTYVGDLLFRHHPYVTPSPWIHGLLIYAGLGFEIAIFLSLLFGRSRYLGIWLTYVFFGVLGILDHEMYATIPGALIFMFLTEEERSVLSEKIKRWAQKKALWLGLVGLIGLSIIFNRSLRWHAIYFPWVFSHALIGWLLLNAQQKRLKVESSWLRPTKRSALALIPLAYFLVGFSPYLGLSMKPAITMYSNVNTDQSQWNHFILPSEMQVIRRYQYPLVRIEDADHPDLEYFSKRKFWQPLFKLRRLIYDLKKKGETNLRVVYNLRGREYVTTNAETDPFLIQPYGWLERKLIRVRKLTANKETICP